MKNKIYLTISIISVVLSLGIIGCTSHIINLRGPGIRNNGTITIYTHNMPEKMHKAVVNAGMIIQRNIF